ncbi:arsenite methyltransferase [Pelomyxa schiedti]|nr:arsenite methyltransferase [Pelomyxa schiedti]
MTDRDGRIAMAFGRSVDELRSIPTDRYSANLFYPSSFANIRPGEVVVSLGCGAGMDSFMAAKTAGPTGHIIGVDITAATLELAKSNAVRQGISNAEFRLYEMDRMPIDSNSVDVIVGGCFLSRVPNKYQVMTEMYRILKPGGRLCLSDMALKQPHPENPFLSGAMLIGDYISQLNSTGFTNSIVVEFGTEQSQGNPLGFLSPTPTTSATSFCGNSVGVPTSSRGTTEFSSTGSNDISLGNVALSGNQCGVATPTSHLPIKVYAVKV